MATICNQCKSKTEKCPSCGGSGRSWGTCTTCSGTGHVCPKGHKNWHAQSAGFFGGTRSTPTCRKGHKTAECPLCKGVSGRTHRDCGGTGYICPVDGPYWK